MTRTAALTLIAVAAYHGDSDTAMRIYVEHRTIAHAAYLAAYRRGVALRASGAPCGCHACAAARNGTQQTEATR